MPNYSGPKGQLLLEELSEVRSEIQFEHTIYSLARLYAGYLGVDFDKSILPNLQNREWWNADYGVSIVDGGSVGMSTVDALRCLVDLPRTQKIAEGIRQEVKFLRNQLMGKDLAGIDAGTGTGILALLLLSAGVREVYAIEYNKQSYETTKRFLKDINLANRVHLLFGDATTIAIPNHSNEKADILVSENLSTGLLDEPQYKIIKNLSQYLSAHASIIPKSATLAVAAGSASWLVRDTVNGGPWWHLKNVFVESAWITYARIESVLNMNIPTFDRHLSLHVPRNTTINAIYLSTEFDVNQHGTKYKLNPDSCSFLGKTIAYKVEGVVDTSQGIVELSIRYEAGRMADRLRATANENSIFLGEDLQ